MPCQWPRQQMVATLLAVSIAMGMPTIMSAQEAGAPSAGAKVRAVVHGPPAFTVTGTLLRNTRDSIVIGGLGVGVPSTYAKSALQRLEVSQQRRTSEDAFARGAKGGALVGLAIGLILITNAAIEDNRNPCHDCYANQKVLMALATVPITAVTALLGGAIGLVGREQWVAVPLG